MLGVSVDWLWPSLGGGRIRGAGVTQDRFDLYSQLADIPEHIIGGIIMSARRHLDIVSSTNWFLHLFATPALGYSKFTPVRVLTSPGIGWDAGYPVRELRVLRRAHDDIGVGSMLRADDTMLLCPSFLGADSPEAPILLLVRTGRHGAFDSYVERFEHMWAGAAGSDGRSAFSALSV